MDFIKIENISLSQQTDTTNNTTETNTETINYVDNDYLNNDKIATVSLNTALSLTDNYIWIPETTDNVVPGLDSLLTYLQSEFATLTALQNSTTIINNILNNDISNIQTEINNILLTHRLLVRTYHIIQAILVLCIRGILLTTTEDNRNNNRELTTTYNNR